MNRFAVVSSLMAVSLLAVSAQEESAPAPLRPARENQVALFNGRDLAGFTFCSPTGAAPAATWSVTNGVIHCTGQPAGYLRTTQSYSNYFLTVEWRFRQLGPQADNTGILLHIQPPDRVWPRCVQVQGKHGHQGDLFVMGGAEAKEHQGMDANTPVPLRGPSREKPVGEWNTAETICLHRHVTSFINGYFVNEITECTLDDGAIGIQSEGGDIEIRTISFCPLKY